LSIVPSSVVRHLERLRRAYSDEAARARIASRPADPPKPLGFARRASAATIGKFWDKIVGTSVSAADRAQLADPATLASAERYSSNIENMIGTVKMPVGIVGPMRVNGIHAFGDYLVPLATTEAALVASYARGAHLATEAGGIAAALINEGVLRTPVFIFATVAEVGIFVEWLVKSEDALKAAAESTTRYGQLISLEPSADNEIVFLRCRYTTGNASGQNMVTIATEAMCRFIEEKAPVKPQRWYIEGNFSGDKKASALGSIMGRGRKVSASVTIPAHLVEKRLHVTVPRLLDFGRIAGLGALLSGQMGAQGHYANGLAALYIATGQDAACVSESAVGITRMEARGEDLFLSVTLPNVLVGTVGGGTGLPSQRAALNLLGLSGENSAAALAEIVAALCLCGELSIMGAIAAGDFARAHKKLARGRQ
jgi:hydroxymethylglutaryl-CoA reductase (NADPH)